MSKRFTDTNKWDDDWYLSLPPRYKCVWSWLCDHCDGIGFQKISLKKLSNEVGEAITREEFEVHFSERLHWIKEDTVWVHGFIRAQYKQLSQANKAHMNIARKAIKDLEGQALFGKAQSVYEMLLNFIQSSFEIHDSPVRGPDESQAGDIGNRKQEIGNRKKKKGGVGENKPAFDFDSLYQKYPRRIEKQASLKRCVEVIQSAEDYAAVSIAIDRYAAHCAKNKTLPEHIKHMTSFLEKRDSKPYIQPWRDWLDPENGSVQLPAAAEPEWKRKAREEEEKSNAS